MVKTFLSQQLNKRREAKWPWEEEEELPPVSEDVTAAGTPALMEKADLEVLKTKSKGLRDKLLEGITANEFFNYGFETEDQMRKVGVIGNNERVWFNRDPVTPETIVQIEKRKPDISLVDYATIPTGDDLGSKITRTINPIIRIGGVEFQPSTIAGLALLAKGGLDVLKGGQAVFNRQIFSRSFDKLAETKGIPQTAEYQAKKMEAMNWAEANIKPSKMTRMSIQELLNGLKKEMVGGGAPLAPREPNLPAPKAAQEAMKTAGQIIPPAVQAAAGAAGKQPWEMTREEIGKLTNKDVNEIIKGNEWQIERDVYKKLIKDTSLGASKKQNYVIADQVHKLSVQRALSEGKEVPESVLVDYPDLQASKASEVAPSTSVQAGLPGVGPEVAQVKAFEEVSGKTGQKQPLIDVAKYQEQAVARAETERLKGLGQLTLNEKAGVSSTGQRIPVTKKPRAKATVKPPTTKEVKAAETARQEAVKEVNNIVSQNDRETSASMIQTEINDMGNELAARSAPYHARVKNTYPNVSTPELDAKIQVYQDTLNRISQEPVTAQPPAPTVESKAGEATEVEAGEAVIPPPPVPPEPAQLVPPGGPPPSGAIPPTQPPSGPPEYSNPEPVKSDGGIEFASLQNAKDVIDIATKPDFSRKLANLPLIKEVFSKVNPSAIANTPAQKGIIIRAVLRDEATQKSQGVMAYLNQLGDQDKIFGKLDDKGLISKGKLKGISVNDIRTYPNKYDLTLEQKIWVQSANEIEKAKLKYLRDNGIEIKELTFEEGGQYAGRRVYAKMTGDGELLESSYIGAGPSRVGGKISFEKQRFFETAKEAIDAGFKYLKDDEALSLNVRGAYNKVADKQMSEWILENIPWRSTGAPDELILAAQAAKNRLNKSNQLLAALNRANRGEKVPTVTINSIASIYPKEAELLRNFVELKQSGQDVKTQLKDIREGAKALIDYANYEYNKAVNARARAREKAMTPGYEEAMVMHPAFQGKVFTGPDAKKTADALRQSLDPALSKALESVNKVNSLLRYFKLAGDASPFGIQLLYLLGQNPKIYAGSGVAFTRAVFDKEFQATYISKNKSVIDRHPNLIISQLGNEFTEALSRSGILRTGMMKVGGVILGPFQQGFESAMDYAGIEMAKSLEHLCKTPEDFAGLDQFINEFRGMTSSAKLGVSPNWRAFETLTLLAPRYNRAIASLLFDSIKGTLNIGRAPLRQKLARNGLGRGIAAVVVMFIACGYALGKDWDEIEATLDPRSSKFLTYEVNGVNIGPGTKIRSVIRLVGECVDHPEQIFYKGMENPVLRFVRGNLSMVVGNSIDLLTGKDYIGDPVRDNWGNFVREEVISQFMPVWVENVVYEGGDLFQRLIRGAGEFFGGRAYPETNSDVVKRLYDKYAAQDYGLKYESLNKEQREELKRKHEDLSQAVSENEKYWSQQGSEIEKTAYAIEKQITEQRNASLVKAAIALQAGEITKYDYDKERGYIRPYYSGGREVLYSLQEMNKTEAEIKSYEAYLDKRKPEDKALNEYQEYYGKLIEEADLPVDYDIIERELETFMSKFTPEIQEYVLRNKDNWIKDLPEPAKTIELQRITGIEDESWWDDYRGSQGVPNLNPPSLKTPSLKAPSIGGTTTPRKKKTIGNYIR